MDLEEAAKQSINASSLLRIIEARNELDHIDLGFQAMKDAILIGEKIR